MFLGILMGGSLGVGLAFLIFGSLLNRSNNHGDSLGENSRYTGGIAYSARIDKSLHKPAAQTEFLNTYYTPLYPDPVFKNPQAKVVRKMPAPQAPAMQANPAAPVSPQAAVTAAAAATGFPSSTAFPTAPAAQAVQAAQVATVQAAQNYQAVQNYQAAPAAPNYQAAPTGYQAAPGYPTAPMGYQPPASQNYPTPPAQQ